MYPKTYIVKEYSNRVEYRNEQWQLHRESGPAIEWENGQQEWYQNDQLHRLDGPAVQFGDGTKEYWIKGKQYPEDKFTQKVKELNNQNQENTLTFNGKTYKLVEKQEYQKSKENAEWNLLYKRLDDENS